MAGGQTPCSALNTVTVRLLSVQKVASRLLVLGKHFLLALVGMYGALVLVGGTYLGLLHLLRCNLLHMHHLGLHSQSTKHGIHESCTIQWWKQVHSRAPCM